MATPSNAYQQVIDSPLADAATRSLSKIGLGVTLEKIAEQKSEDEATASLKLALDQYLDVFYGNNLREGEEPDTSSVRKAGLEAGRLAEALHDWTAATNVYRRLEQMVPSMRARLEKNILKAQDHLNGSRN